MYPPSCPRLEGPLGTEGRVTELYFRIEERLEQRGVGAVALRLSGRGSWEFELSNGITVRLGSRLTEQRIERFFVAFDRVVAARPEAVAYVDMRYTNGFAIGWKEREETQPNV